MPADVAQLTVPPARQRREAGLRGSSAEVPFRNFRLGGGGGS
jgi:hypothetical protein